MVDLIATLNKAYQGDKNIRNLRYDIITKENKNSGFSK